jgi:hypothetical protein
MTNQSETLTPEEYKNYKSKAGFAIVERVNLLSGKKESYFVVRKSGTLYKALCDFCVKNRLFLYRGNRVNKKTWYAFLDYLIEPVLKEKLGD